MTGMKYKWKRVSHESYDCNSNVISMRSSKREQFQAFAFLLKFKKNKIIECANVWITCCQCTIFHEDLSFLFY